MEERMSFSSKVGYCLSVSAFLLFAGCGKTGSSRSGAAIALEGKVTLKGQPVTGGKLIFALRSGQGSLETPINSDGSYKLGIPAGEADVGVDTESLKKDLDEYARHGGVPIGVENKQDKIIARGKTKGTTEEKAKMEKMPGMFKGGSGQSDLAKKKYVPIPEKYRDPKTSGVVVKAESTDGTQQKNIDLP